MKQVVRVLLDAGAEVDGGMPDGLTPLQAAAGRRHAGVVAALLDAGADVAAPAMLGGTVLHIASMHGQILNPQFYTLHILNPKP